MAQMKGIRVLRYMNIESTETFRDINMHRLTDCDHHQIDAVKNLC